MEWGPPEERTVRRLEETNKHLVRLVFEQQQTNRLLITLLQGLNIPDPNQQPTPPPGPPPAPTS